MTQRELKEKLYDLVSIYFGGATIVWGRSKKVRSQSPLIALTTGSIIRPYQPITQTVNGVPINCYPSKMTVQVDLFTKGAALDDGDDMTATMENTAVNDLTDFVNFLNSAYVDDWTSLNDVSILANTVQDLTQIIGDTAWDYRAMVELEIGFTQTAVGYAATMYENGMPYFENGKPKYDSDSYPLDESGNRLPPPVDEDGNPIWPVDDEGNPLPPGIPSFEETPSGGRTEELAGQSIGWFEQVDGPEYEQEEDSSNG